MSAGFDLILKNGRVVTPQGIVAADVAVIEGKISELGRFDTAAKIIDCKNLVILPGVIDSHVHFREPGGTHKEDIATGTMSAIFGGVTSVFEMPNTDPLTVTSAALADKLARANKTAFCDYAFYIGGCAENAKWLKDLERLVGCAGVKVFMGSSTGALLADDDDVLREIFKSGTRRIALHAEDEARLIARKHLARRVSDHPLWRDDTCALIAVRRAVALARETARKIHILHVTSAEEMAFLKSCKDVATAEVTPQHLTLTAPECYDRLGTRAQMNPPLRDQEHQDALWRGIADGTVTTIGSDHAPHTIQEKEKPYPASPSGMPGVQTILPVMLDHVHAGRLSLEKMADLLCHNPAQLYGLRGKGKIAAGYDADFAIVDPAASWTITNTWIKSKCGWTPYDGKTIHGRIFATILRGQVLLQEDEQIVTNPTGCMAAFEGFLPIAQINDPADIAPQHPTCCA